MPWGSEATVPRRDPQKTRRKRPVPSDMAAVSSVVGVILMVAAATVLASGAYAIMSGYFQEHKDPHLQAFALDRDVDGRWVLTPVGGEKALVADTTLRLRINGTETVYGLQEALDAMGVNATYWGSTPVCLAGPPPCLVGAAETVQVMVVVDGQLVFQAEQTERSFRIQNDGSIFFVCSGPVTVQVVGVAITYGAGGPDIPVTAEITADAGATLTPLNPGPVTGGETAFIPYVEAESLLGIVGTADGYGFTASYASYQTDPHVLVLPDGGDVPSIPAFGSQTAIEDFLAPYVDVSTQKVVLASNQVLVLYEFNPDLNNAAADFQDLVVLFTFPNTGCEI